jgi:hypothetical protein
MAVGPPPITCEEKDQLRADFLFNDRDTCPPTQIVTRSGLIILDQACGQGARPIRKALQPPWVVSIFERPATPPPGVRRGDETTSKFIEPRAECQPTNCRKRASQETYYLDSYGHYINFFQCGFQRTISPDSGGKRFSSLVFGH